MSVKMIKEGLLIPKSILDELGEFEVLTRGREILIRPKTNTRKYLGFAREGEGEYDEELVKQLEDSYLGRGED